jgi:uncharacterized membrane protein
MMKNNFVYGISAAVAIVIVNYFSPLLKVQPMTFLYFLYYVVLFAYIAFLIFGVIKVVKDKEKKLYLKVIWISCFVLFPFIVELIYYIIGFKKKKNI